MEGLQKQEAVSENEKIAKLRNEAPALAMQLLSERLESGIDASSSDERIAALAQLIDELSEVVEGTTTPIDNNNRFVVERLAEMRTNEEANQELEPMIKEIEERVENEARKAA